MEIVTERSWLFCPRRRSAQFRAELFCCGNLGCLAVGKRCHAGLGKRMPCLLAPAALGEQAGERRFVEARVVGTETEGQAA